MHRRLEESRIGADFFWLFQIPLSSVETGLLAQKKYGLVIITYPPPTKLTRPDTYPYPYPEKYTPHSQEIEKQKRAFLYRRGGSPVKR